jgi:hypothetical protein
MVSGKFCPVCKKKNTMDAAECVYCSTPFEIGKPEARTTSSQSEAPQTQLLASVDRSTQRLRRLEDVPADVLVVYQMDSEDPVAFMEWNKIILGRLSGNLGDTKIVDLTPFGAERMGVSRHHALIVRVEDGYTVQDLNSTNGTWLDRQRLQSVQVYPLAAGAVLQLGQLKLQVYYRTPETRKSDVEGQVRQV